MLHLKKINEWVCKAPQRHPLEKQAKQHTHSPAVHDVNSSMKEINAWEIQIYCHGALACWRFAPRLSFRKRPCCDSSVVSPEDLFHWHVVVARGSLETCRDWSECPGFRIAPWGWTGTCRWKRLPDTAIHLQVPSNIASNSKSTMDDKHMLLVKMFRGCPVILIHWFTEG